jgi:hypothetical protein
MNVFMKGCCIGLVAYSLGLEITCLNWWLFAIPMNIIIFMKH